MSDATAEALLFLHAQTPIHPGSGTALGVVDLPVQRERHTDWPVIPGSSLKGVLRDARRRAVSGKSLKGADDDPAVVEAFGPPTKDAGAHAGALSVSDARILAFPVRSLRGVFAWTTCPAIIERLNRDLAVAGGKGPTCPKVGGEQAFCAEKSPLVLEGGKLVLEEFEFERKGDAGAVAKWIAEHATSDADWADRIRSHLAVLGDDDFTHFVRHATEVTARIALDYETKTVSGGALFYQEFLPAETLFYSVVTASRSRRKENGKDATGADKILGDLRETLERKPYLQIGGDETTGKGLCAVRFADVKGA